MILIDSFLKSPLMWYIKSSVRFKPVVDNQVLNNIN